MKPKTSRALRFVLLIGTMSLFADFAYEGARSILGPFLASLGATGSAVGVIAGLGELLGYGLRLIAGKLADRTQKFWPMVILGFVVQMIAVPTLAFAGSWPAAAVLICLERSGKATRNPPKNALLAHAAQELGGFGWAFGVDKALDQTGALLGPLAMAWMLSRGEGFHKSFALLTLPAVITLFILGLTRLSYPKPEELEAKQANFKTEGLPRVFWIYFVGAALVAAGFADFPLIAFHLVKANAQREQWAPILYAVAMATAGVAALAVGRWFDRKGLMVLIPLTLISALYAPLAFGKSFGAVIAGVALWGLGMGVHESVIVAAVAPMVPQDKRASAFGLFTAGFGVAWFLGSVLMGLLYDRSVPWMMVAAVSLQLLALPFFFAAARHTRQA